ncbi:hypothetical protein HYS85_00580 [Candidatus Saccharibacteria bacterium]|nr:hypothetical protein [Candidatus Saccharibacteria bacterium]
MADPVRFPNLHLLLSGESGSGKSSFWATVIAYWAKHFGEPSLVFMFDPMDKATPYTDLGTVAPMDTELDANRYYKELGVKVNDVLDKAGKLICRVEYYSDEEPESPTALTKFERRMVGFTKSASNWASIGVDSMTFLQHMALLRAKVESGFKQFQPGTDGRQWYARVTEDVATLLFSRAAYWDTNVGIICHVDDRKEDFGEMGQLKTAALQGRMAKRAPAGFGEVYKLHVVRGKDGVKRQLQTVSDEKWMCNNLVTKAPNPCDPTYDALWKNWKAL